ncbi:MAG TPA: histidinol dehydrogenase [Victivallales bacterium]|nr:histidinol dehydrogenase [Victivallales bacterium]HPO89546.1 histidinol dehydrogenase [Victivallales bacterium]HRU01072.1 histidinol dehydrogenase [Victivallales bacterium]
MKILDTKNKNDLNSLFALFNRDAYPKQIEKELSLILEEVAQKGDKAVAKFARKFDGIELQKDMFRIKEDEFKEAEKNLNDEVKKSILFAINNIQDFAKRQIPKSYRFSPRKGVILGEKFTPLNRVAVYIPGGTAPLVSTAIHTIAIAKIAGVKEIVATTPPGEKGKIPDAILFAMKNAGITEAYRLGGVYGIAALAYGTESIKKVEKIVGPGNAYVTAAKKMIYGKTGIDMVAGPSEIMIIADSSAKSKFIAADLLSQAEHGSGFEQSVLLTNDKKLIEKTAHEIEKLSNDIIKKSKPLKKVIENGLFLVLVRNLEEAAKIASEYAPEHLEILCENPERVANKISAAGAIFIGCWTPEAVGDYVAGPSHVLPTGGTAKFFNGLSTEHFFRRSSIIKYSKDALKKESNAIMKIAELEGLDAHKLSVKLRVES